MAKFKEIADVLDEYYLDIDGTIDMEAAEDKFYDVLECDKDAQRYIKDSNCPILYVAEYFIFSNNASLIDLHRLSISRKQSMKWVKSRTPDLMRLFIDLSANWRQAHKEEMK